MKVDAVSSVGFKNSYSFGTSSKRDETGVVDYTPSSSPSLMKKVPVIVLLAMNPATLNSAIPMMPETDNPNQIVMLAPETKSADAATYVIAPEIQTLQQSNTRPWFEDGEKLIYQKSFISDGKRYNMEYSSFDGYKIDNIYFVPQGYVPVRTKYAGLTKPPSFHKLLLHYNGNDDEAFMGVVTNELASDKKNEDYIYVEKEIKLPNDIANKLSDDLSDSSRRGKYIQKDYISQTKSMSLLKTSIY